MRLVLVFLFVVIMAQPYAWSDLSFDKKRVSYHAGVLDEVFTAEFTFRNRGKLPIEIKQVDSNCGCLRAEADKKIYKKGATGKITAEFKIGSLEGKQTKQVWVQFVEMKPIVKPKVVRSSAPLATSVTERSLSPADPPAPVIIPETPITERLTVEITVPTLIAIEPKITRWTQKSAPESRTVSVTMHHDAPIHLKSATSSMENVAVEWEEVTAGEHYQLTLTPKSTEETQLGLITLMTDCEIGKHQKKQAFFVIERPGLDPDPKPEPKADPEPEPEPDDLEVVESPAQVAQQTPRTDPVTSGGDTASDASEVEQRLPNTTGEPQS